MLKFIDENLKYPEEALHQRIEGTVHLEYVLNGLGKIVDVKVLEGIGYGCDKEAIRLIKSLVFEKVYNKGLNTRTRRSLKIHFRLPKKKRVQLNYQLVSSKPKETTPKNKPTTTYQINVTIPIKNRG